jgi:hypothetical protein
MCAALAEAYHPSALNVQQLNMQLFRPHQALLGNLRGGFKRLLYAGQVVPN